MTEHAPDQGAEPTTAAEQARDAEVPSDPAAQPQPPAPPANEPPPSAELVEARRRVQLETWAATQEVQRAAWDVEAPRTLRERLVYAGQLAEADMLPTSYRKKPANVLLAIEVGDELGLPRMASLRLLTVVDNKPSLGAEGTRAVILARGHELRTEAPWCHRHMLAREVCEENDNRGCRFGLLINAYGLPLEATVTGRRRDTETEHSATFTLLQAERAGLCTLVREEGEVVRVTARSNNNNPLPWETYTEAMLEARATTTLARRLFADVTGGLAYTEDELAAGGPVGGAVAAVQRLAPGGPVPGPSRAVVGQVDAYVPGDVVRAPEPLAEPVTDAEVVEEVPTIRRTDRPEGWLPEDDLATTGPAWWEHAGATVRRRSPVQLAADRLAIALGEGNDDVPLPPADAELQPAVAALVRQHGAARWAEQGLAEILEEGDPSTWPTRTKTTELPPADVETVEDALHAVQELAGVPDDAPAFPVPDEELAVETAELADPDRPAGAQPVMADEPDPFTLELDAAPPMAEPSEDELAELNRPPRDALWADVEAMATQRGKTVDQLLARLVIAERCEIDELTDEALWRWIQAQRAAGLAD